MDQPADFAIEQDAGSIRLALRGDWTSAGLGRAGERLAKTVKAPQEVSLDLAGLGRFDSAGAYVLTRSAGVKANEAGLAARPDVQRLVAFVGKAMTDQPSERSRPMNPVGHTLIRIGAAVFNIIHELYQTLVFYGRLLAALGRVAVDPRRIRIAPTVALMERAGLDALPIIAVTNFFVGATIGFLGEDLLNQFGAQAYAVELIGIGVLREFGVLVTAIILSGRSASSFAAEIGAMKMNQEVDAMQVMGVDPFEALIIPRFIAMLTMMPLLTFVAMVSGLLGGLIVIWTTAGLSPTFFIQRMLDNVSVQHFYMGMVKAPVMAVVIAAIGCRQGMEVGGDVEQLGRRVTTAVVQALFSVIIIDAIFALIFMAMGL
jgi:phospholipid/cholesterol/gamma-HCH transport system permease protein